MKLLAITPELPFAPGGHGGNTRQFHLLAGLAERGHDVSVAATVAPEQAAGAERLRAAGVRLHASPRPGSRVRETLRALADAPGLVPRVAREPVLAWQVAVFWTALRHQAARAIAEQRPDVLLVEHDWAAAWRRDLPPSIPCALTLQNLSWRYYAARAQAARGLRAAALRLEARRFERFDRLHLPGFDLLLAMSEDDRRAVSEVSRVTCEVIPNGVDTGRVPAPEPVAPDHPLVLFTGTFGYPPNAEALEWLLGDIWPRVRAGAPAARLAVVGPNPPEAATRLADESVTLTGWVEDMGPWFERASVIVIPLRSGGGTRLKVLDGLAARRALVSTTIGAEGIDVRDGEHLLLADGAEAFAAAVLRLLGDAPLRSRLAQAARALAEQTYDWHVVTDRLEAAFAALIARPVEVP